MHNAHAYFIQLIYTPYTSHSSICCYALRIGMHSTNFLAYAPGGGVENIGLSQAVVDMLVQCSNNGNNGTIHLFPAWPKAEPAAFTTLRVKGALLVTARWDPSQQKAVDVSVTATASTVTSRVSLANPFGDAADGITVRCSETATREVKRDGQGNFEWLMGSGEVCWLEPH